MIQHRIAVIGAGIAGLSCATTLQKAGHLVELFDKGRGLGGRLSTRRTEQWQCDHGAPYFTASRSDFVSQVDQWVEAGVVGAWEPVVRVYHEGQWSSPHDTPKRYVGLPGMSAPVRAMSKGLSVQTSTTIQTMSHTPTGWQLTSTEHGLLPNHYAKVVFAIPPRQVGPILGTHSQTISSVADSCAMQPCWTVMMQFNAPLDLSFDAAFIHSGPLSFVARNSSKPERTGLESWVVHATPAWSLSHLERKPDEITALLLAEFHKLGGPSPVSCTAHRWRYGRSDPDMAIGSVWDAETQIGLCGDWLNGGDVEGAWLSGRALANQME